MSYDLASMKIPPTAEPAKTLDAHDPASVAIPALESPAYMLVFEESSTRMFPLSADGECVIGRGEACELRVEDQRVSRTHARLTMSGGQARLHDLGSQNGTRVNEERVKDSILLTSGDVIGIGSVALVFHTSSRALRAPVVLDLPAFRARLEGEVERAKRFSRPLSLVALAFPSATVAQGRASLQGVLGTVLRRSDLAGWSAPTQLMLLLPETDGEGGRALAQTLLDALGDLSLEARAGLASCPDDAIEPEALFAAARAAATIPERRGVALAPSTAQVIELGTNTAVVADPAMVRLYELAQRLASSQLAVLIRGETGSGKELVATALHHFSSRAQQRLVSVNCAALQETLLESELFGHERGAFTGATTTRPGLFEAADGGTLFLDEVGEMSPALQSKLLRVLETQRITRVGDTRERTVDVRIVAATHRELAEEVKAGRFREDLFFRLSGATLWIPPLRDRPRELPLLARQFLGKVCERTGKPAPILTQDAQLRLAAHAWPGNVRELRNVMEYLAATAMDETIEAWHVSARLEEPSAAERAPRAAAAPATSGTLAFRPLADEVRELEERRMVQALEACDWNQTRAAGAIQMPLRTFVSRFKQYDLGRRRTR